MSWLHGVYNYFVPAGDGVIGGAIVSVLLLALPAARLWFKHMKPHIKRTKEIHQHLDPSHPFKLGDDDALE